MLKTVKMIVDFRRHPSPQLPLTLSSCLVSTVETFKFLGITVSPDLKWATNINSVLKNAQQRMYFLRLLRKHGLPRQLLRQFYTAVIESVLCSSITVWFGAATKKDKLRLQRTIKTAERIVGTPLPTLEDLHAARTKTRACKILSDPPHPGHRLFQLLPSAETLKCLGHGKVAGPCHLWRLLAGDEELEVITVAQRVPRVAVEKMASGDKAGQGWTIGSTVPSSPGPAWEQLTMQCWPSSVHPWTWPRTGSSLCSSWSCAELTTSTLGAMGDAVRLSMKVST
ncbi:uncharacterized protein LOC133479952 [Phyllopteryx taeniolatus]|uniref:uncharacterized protein LOC133479952 n=1 Tax=Phyllopteryx taeniolatus TaxID=161469 RepID=UPI002AD3D17E|nr:uncharacterized protein LOC133479952 [Phyllopteryx taeniolatus]XP_061633518.1 uncharacterized protein LOC133479952 [Phyllopteryx taeniolatus]